MTKMIRTTFQRADPMMFRSESFFFFFSFFLLNYIPVWSVSSTRSTAYINIKNILLAMALCCMYFNSPSGETLVSIFLGFFFFSLNKPLFYFFYFSIYLIPLH